MAKQNQAAEAQPDKKQQSKTEPAGVTDLANGAVPGDLFKAAGQGSGQGPAARLGDPRLQTAQRQALAAQLGRVQGNHYLQRTLASLPQNHPQPKIQPRPAQPNHLARKEGDQPKAGIQPPPARAIGISFSLSGLVVSVQKGAVFKPGPRGPQAMKIILKALLGPQYPPGLEDKVFSELSTRTDIHYYSWTLGVAKQGEQFPYELSMDAIFASVLVKVLETQFKLKVDLSDHQRELLSLGISVKKAWDRLHDPDMAAQLGGTFPEWYDKFLFARQLAQHADLLRQFSQALKQFEANPSQKTQQEFMTTLQQIGQALLARVKIWEAIRADKKLAADLGEIVEKIHNDPTFLTMFLNYTATQPSYAKRALTEHAARAELLRRFINYARRTLHLDNKGDEVLAKQPSRATDSALPARLTSFPPVGPPLFDAALGTDHTFVMSIEYPDIFEAFGLWTYKWDYLLLPPPDSKKEPATPNKGEGQKPAGEAGNDLDSLAHSDIKGQKPTGWGEIYANRLDRAQQYARADIERVTNELGPAGVTTAGLVQANNILRYAGTVVKTFLESVFQPRYEQKIIFPNEGLYMVRCRATHASDQDAEVTRESSVAYTLVYARDPNWMAQTRVQLGIKSLAETKGQIAELEAELAKNPDQPQLRQKLQELKLALGPLGPILGQQRQDFTTRIAELKKQIQEAKATGKSSYELEQQLKATEKQLKNLDERIENRSDHAGLHRPGATPERLIASFVSDTGQTVGLDLEAIEVGRTKNKFKYYVADSTTPNSEDETGEGTTRAEAILDALRTILEGGSGYGRGRVSVHIDGQIYTRRIEASLGSLLGEAVENIANILAVAAIVAAPLTGGTSLTLLLPIGAIGAIPAAYRLVDRGLEGRLKWDTATLMDIVNVAGALAGVTQVVATPLRLVRVGKGAMIFGLGADGLGVVVIPVAIVEQLKGLEGLPPGERAARTMMIIGSALKEVGVMAGQALVRRSLEMRNLLDSDQDGQAGGETSGAKPQGGEGETGSGAGGETPGAKPKGGEGETGPADLNLTSPDGYREARARMEAGGARGQQAAEMVIRNIPDWKGALRKRTEKGGDLGPGSRNALDQARRAMVDEARNKVKQTFPEIVIRDVGSRGFNSDIDVTFNPPEPTRLSDPAAVAQAVERSGQAARQFMAELRQRSGGEPDVSLDTNAYIYTGMESAMPVPAAQAGAVAQVMDVTSLVEIRRGLQTGDPAGAQATWNTFKEKALQRAGAETQDSPQQAKIAEQVKERLEQQFNKAEAMYERVVALEAETRQRLTQGGGPTDPESLVARTSEVAVEQRQQELVKALRQEPIDHVRVRELQAEIKLLERGAYATRAAVADVVDHQQTATSADRAARPGEKVKHRTTGEDMSQGAPVKDPRLLTQSAGSTLGQLLAHLQAGESLTSQLKAVAKYCYRIDHAREQLGMRSDVPEIRNNFTHAKLFGSGDLGSDGVLTRMVQQWAEANNLGKLPFEKQAQAYIDFRTQWAKDAVIGMRIRTESEAAIKDGSPGESPDDRPTKKMPTVTVPDDTPSHERPTKEIPAVTVPDDTPSSDRPTGKLPAVTPEGQEGSGAGRPADLPWPTVREEANVWRGSWRGDAGAKVMIEYRTGMLVVMDVYRGNQPKGSAGHMLADVITSAQQQLKIQTPPMIRISNLQPAPSRLAFEAGKPAIDDPVFGGMIQTLIQRLGFQAQRIEYTMTAGKLNIDLVKDAPGQAGPTSGPGGPASGQAPTSQVKRGRPDSPEVDQARLGPVSEKTRARLDRQPELRQALAEHPDAANLLMKGEPPSLPSQVTPAQVRRLAALLAEMEAAGFPVRNSAYQKQLRDQFHKLEPFKNLPRALAEFERIVQASQLHMTQQQVIRMAHQGEDISLEPPAKSEVERATKAVKAGRATRQDEIILLRQIVADYRAFRTAQLKQMMGRPGQAGKRKPFSTDRLTAETLHGQCGPGRDLSAESLQSLTHDSPAPVRIERYQFADFLPKHQHGFSIVTLPGGGRYIVDSTFAQFMDAKGPDYTGDSLLGQGATLETAQFARDLLRDGFVPLTRATAYKYARGLGASASDANNIADSLMANKGSMLTEIIANGQVSRFTTTPQDKVDDMDLRDLVRPPGGGTTLSDEVVKAKNQPDLDPGIRETLDDLEERLDDLAKVREGVPIITEEKGK